MKETKEAKAWKFAAGPKLPAGSHLSIIAARVGNVIKVKDPLSGKLIDSVDFSGHVILEPGQELEADVVEFPDRLQGAVDRGDLVILVSPEKK